MPMHYPLQLSCPSKTFVLGEYVALHGGPTLIVNTEPRFTLTISKAESFELQNIESQSPAGRFLLDNRASLDKLLIQFQDPHKQQGGLGASSAQFLMAYALIHQLQAIDTSELLNCYQKYAYPGVGPRPSGADLIAQLHGLLTYFDKNQGVVNTLKWPFTDLGFVLIRTQQKVATHEHLKSLQDFDSHAFANVVEQANHALQSGDRNSFIAAILSYRTLLNEHHFIAPQSLMLLQQLDQIPGVFAAKGCGALGADILLAVIEPAKYSHIEDWCELQKLTIVATESSISMGLDPAIVYNPSA